MSPWIQNRHRVVGPVLIFAGVLLVPWLLYLSFELPNTARARNWSLMWSGIDIAEAAGLITTGVLLWRHSRRRALPAAFTCALLALDAWVDVTTSAPGHVRTLAVIMALAVELPVAVACLVLAISTFPDGPVRSDSTPAEASADAIGRHDADKPFPAHH